MARMHIENARAFIGPFMIVANIVAIFLCLRPKRGISFTLLVLLAYMAAVHRVNGIILRHDMRHEAGVIAEMYRAGKEEQAEAVYERWQASLSKAAPETVCKPDPMFEGVSADVG